MENHKCLSCYHPLGSDIDFHSSCSKKIFDFATPPEFPYTKDQILALATQIIQSQVVLTGVQPKLSLHISKPRKKQPRRFILIGLCRTYDMLSTALVIKSAKDDLALTLNGKRRKLTKKDFNRSMSGFDIPDRSIHNIFSKCSSVISSWIEFIGISFLPKDIKKDYIELIRNNANKMGILQ